jgi:hypothetical protein
MDQVINSYYYFKIYCTWCLFNLIIYKNEISQTKEFHIFKTIGVVTGVTDGIVTIIGMSDVAYVKL